MQAARRHLLRRVRRGEGPCPSKRSRMSARCSRSASARGLMRLTECRVTPDAARYALERQPVEAVIERVLRDGTLPDVRPACPVPRSCQASTWLLRTTASCARCLVFWRCRRCRRLEARRGHLFGTAHAHRSSRSSRPCGRERRSHFAAGQDHQRRGQAARIQGAQSPHGPRRSLARYWDP